MRVVKMSDGPVPYWVVGDEGLVVSPIQEFLRHLATRSFSTKTIRAYAYDLLSYWRWLCLVGCGPFSGNSTAAGTASCISPTPAQTPRLCCPIFP